MEGSQASYGMLDLPRHPSHPGHITTQGNQRSHGSSVRVSYVRPVHAGVANNKATATHHCVHMSCCAHEHVNWCLTEGLVNIEAVENVFAGSIGERKEAIGSHRYLTGCRRTHGSSVLQPAVAPQSWQTAPVQYSAASLPALPPVQPSALQVPPPRPPRKRQTMTDAPRFDMVAKQQFEPQPVSLKAGLAEVAPLWTEAASRNSDKREDPDDMLANALFQVDDVPEQHCMTRTRVECLEATVAVLTRTATAHGVKVRDGLVVESTSAKAQQAPALDPPLGLIGS